MICIKIVVIFIFLNFYSKLLKLFENYFVALNFFHSNQLWQTCTVPQSLVYGIVFLHSNQLIVTQIYCATNSIVWHYIFKILRNCDTNVLCHKVDCVALYFCHSNQWNVIQMYCATNAIINCIRNLMCHKVYCMALYFCHFI